MIKRGPLKTERNSSKKSSNLVINVLYVLVLAPILALILHSERFARLISSYLTLIQSLSLFKSLSKSEFLFFYTLFDLSAI